MAWALLHPVEQGQYQPHDLVQEVFRRRIPEDEVHSWTDLVRRLRNTYVSANLSPANRGTEKP